MTKFVNYETEYTTRNADWPIGISAGAVVYKKSSDTVKVLLLLRNKNTDNPSYNLPKGTLKVDETLENCALREVREEAGVNIELNTYLGASTNTYFYQDTEQIKTFHYFAAKYIDEAGDMDHEHEDKVWLDISTSKIKCAESEPEKNEAIIIERLELFLKKYGG